MKNIRVITIIILLLPVLSFGQLKKDIPQTNISHTLNSAIFNNPFIGLLDPSRFNMQHSFSVSYASMGGYGIMMNSYMNTINYKFSDNLFITTKIGLMNSPYSSLPGENPWQDVKFFGGAELKYLPTENSMIKLRFESTPFYYPTNRYYYHGYRSPLSLFDGEW